jgi:hypothetical protein
MAETARSIVTLSSVKAYLNQPDDSLDTWFEEQIDLASGRIEEYTGKKIQPIAVEEILNGRGGSVLWPKFYPVTALVGTDEATRLGNLQYRDTVVGGWINLMTDEDFILFDPTMSFQIELLEGTTFPAGRANIRIEYIAGYDPIPADLMLVAVEMVAKAYQLSRNGEAALGLQSKSASAAGGSGGVSYLDLEPKWKIVMDRYRSLV